MVSRLTRREFGIAAAALATYPFNARTKSADGKTLRFIAQSDLTIRDPIWTTAYITRNHGYMIFDTLFALDSAFKPQPQMVGAYEISSDGLRYSFTLRGGLKFHDGEPVGAIDCIASLRRWMARDALGQSLAITVDTMKPKDRASFTIQLKEPFPLLIDAIAKVSSIPAFMMPERLAKTDPFQQITEMVGSGPFKFVAEEFEPGSKVVYVKNADYLPRDEPASWAAGGKVVKVDRVEWLNLPDAATKAAALASGEVDWWENPPSDLVPALATNAKIAVAKSDPLGSLTMLRFNQLNPPFDNVKMRRAVMAVVDQREFMSALAGDPSNWRVCPSFFTCGTPMANNAGSEALTSKRDFATAKRLVAEAGYIGEKIVVLDAVELPVSHAQALVVFDLLKKLELNVELVARDWGNIAIRRMSTRPADEGGWSVFGTGWVGADLLDPSVNVMLRANGAGAWFGWPSDDNLEQLRSEWLKTNDREAREQITVRIQERAFETVPYIPTGQWSPMTAYRQNIKGIIAAPALFMWNVEKT